MSIKYPKHLGSLTQFILFRKKDTGLWDKRPDYTLPHLAKPGYVETWEFITEYLSEPQFFQLLNEENDIYLHRVKW